MRNLSILFCLLVLAALSCVSEEKSPESKGRILAGIREGLSEEDVLDLLGRPYEIRKIPGDRLLDGCRVYSSSNPNNGESYRWAYGAKQKGTFARIGIVSFDKNRRVVSARSPVYGYSQDGKIDIPFSDREIPTSSGLRCRLDEVSFTEARGETVRNYAANVSLLNRGESEYVLKYDTVSIHFLVIVEIYDANRKLIFQDNHLWYHSPYSFDESEWPILQLAPGQTVSEQTNVSPGNYFGPLPPGKYYLRVCFPFEKWKYSPSNLVAFDVPPLPDNWR